MDAVSCSSNVPETGLDAAAVEQATPNASTPTHFEGKGRNGNDNAQMDRMNHIGEGSREMKLEPPPKTRQNHQNLHSEGNGLRSL